MQKNHKLLIGGASLSAVAMGVALTGGTSAFYYDPETVGGNSISTCDFNLAHPDVSVTQTEFADPAQNQVVIDSTGGNINVKGLQPGDGFTAVISLTNTGSCSGDLWADIDNHTLNGLSDALRVNGSFKDADLPIVNAGPVSWTTAALDYPRILDNDFGTSDTNTITLHFLWPESGVAGAENSLMGQSIGFSMKFAEIQSGHTPSGALS